MLQIKKVHHIALICAEFERSKHFYTDIMGFSIIKETYRAERDSYKLDLALNGEYLIELFTFPSPPPRPSQPEAAGLRHLAFAVEDIEANIAWLNQNGVATEPIRIDPITGNRFTFFADPDGLPLELYEVK